MKYTSDIIEQARIAWIAGEPVDQICTRLGVNSRRTLYRWRDKNNWDVPRNQDSALMTTTRRYNALIECDKKNKSDWEEIYKLAEIILKFEKVEIYKQGGHTGKGRPPNAKNTGNPKNRKRKKNDVSELTQADFDRIETEVFHYEHQKIWLHSGENEAFRQRFVLKSRQIGATYTFGYQAFKWAVLKGHNQLFISSTRAQAEVFKSYISILVREHFGIEITGNPVKLSNGAELHFLSPAGYTDSRAGDVWFDECFKTRKFKEMEALAAPMATHKQFKKTYFSSPTAISHEAYEKWSGEHYTRFHKKKNITIDIDVPKKGDCELTLGRFDPDGFWRNAITIHDAIRMGWDRVDLDQLKMEMPDPALFAVTYECQFIDDADSVFKLDDILACGVDTDIAWPDYDRTAERPIGSVPCTAGYDPAGVGDNSSFVTLTRPMNLTEKFRMVWKDNWRGIGAPAQCVLIDERTRQFDYDYVEIDATGPGLFIPEFVRPMIYNVNEVKYNPIYKSQMVQKAQAVIGTKRFEYDENDKTLPLAFMTIYQTVTEQGIITYASRRQKDVGHGDEAWATMHAMMCEELNPANAGTMSARTH